MDLAEFVKETLVQISSGVKEAQDSVRSDGGYVNPVARISSSKTDPSHLTSVEGGQNVFLVNFDAAVTVNDDAEVGASAKLKIASFINFGTEGKIGSFTSATNRISFKVPLAFPVDAQSKKNLEESDRSNSEAIAYAYNEMADTNSCENI